MLNEISNRSEEVTVLLDAASRMFVVEAAQSLEEWMPG